MFIKTNREKSMSDGTGLVAWLAKNWIPSLFVLFIATFVGIAVLSRDWLAGKTRISGERLFTRWAGAVIAGYTFWLFALWITLPPPAQMLFVIIGSVMGWSGVDLGKEVINSYLKKAKFH